MKLLLDTHALLWFIGNDPQLSTPARQHIENPQHEFVRVFAPLRLCVNFGCR
jgi:PIN domain nuclease of toxin-antitoxin system